MTNFKIVTKAPPLMQVAANPVRTGKQEWPFTLMKAKFLTIKAQVRAPTGSLIRLP